MPETNEGERVVARIESGDLGVIGMMLQGAQTWCQENHPDYELFARNAPGVAFELFLKTKKVVKRG